MGQQSTASSSGGRRPAGSPPPSQAARRRTTERVAPLEARGSQLPGWFWGALGCLSVLAAGFSILFFTMKPSADPEPALATQQEAPVAPAAAVAPAPVAATPAPASPRPVGIQVEQLARTSAIPAPLSNAANATKKAKPAPRQVKVARSREWAPVAGSENSDEASEDEREEELLNPPKRAKARPSVTAEEEKAEESGSE